MRFIPIHCIQENMELGRDLYGANGQILLKRGTTLTTQYMKRIEELGVNGLYIEDELSKDIEYMELISDELKSKAVHSIKNTFLNIEKDSVNVERAKQDIEGLVNNIVDEILDNKNAIVNMIDLKVFDDYTFYHCVNVSTLSIAIGVALNLNKDQLYKLGLAGLLHDIGKVFVPKEILCKPGKLTDDEFVTIKTHSEKGYRYLRDKFSIPTTSYIGILYHHERYDGNGYPLGKKEQEISLFGRIISIVDVYDALTSDRPYRKAMLPNEAMEYIMANSGIMFDPEITLVFTRKIAPYPIGTCVELSDGRVGLVAENYEDCCLRPKLKIVKEKNEFVEPYFMNLRDDERLRGITIKDILNSIL